MKSRRIATAWLVVLALELGGMLAPAAWARDEQPAPAEIDVSGLGWFGNREQRRSLSRLLGEERGTTLDANAIEDAAFLLLSAVTEQGYLKAVVDAKIAGTDGKTTSVTFDSNLEATLPRSISAQKVEFQVRRGVRYRFREVQVTGLQAMAEESAREYFTGEKVLVARASSRIYSPAHLQRGIDALQNELQRRGYADARVQSRNLRVDDETGNVDVEIAVTEGAKWQVRSVQATARDGAPVEIAELQAFVGQPWSQFWQQDVLAAIRNHFYGLGHPDVRARLREKVGAEEGGVKPVHVFAQVTPGPEVRVGRVRFEGAEQTREQVLRRRVQSHSGDLLNPLAMDQARFRLSRLGIFDAVDLHYEPPEGEVRDPVFRVTEGRELETNLLFGYGSYEQLRGGVELRQFNLFGRAHKTRLLLVQSMKSSRGEYSYTVPELFGESMDATARLFGLKRQETSFLREEYGGNVSMSAPLHRLGVNATLGYTYQALRNRDNRLTTSPADERQVTAASFDGTIVRDRRDNPLRPRHGYRLFAQAETASRYFGSSVDYQRVELGASYHTNWGSGRWLHLGINHGVITTFGGSNDADLPVNKRFYPGGDNSIRGYREGEAAPLGPDGNYLGAKSYLLANVEVEQALTGKWSAVLFVDALGIASRLADYPFDERLYSVGLGLRYQTLIGPLRAEYGRNLNPREVDPRGTLLFSIGFPF